MHNMKRLQYEKKRNETKSIKKRKEKKGFKLKQNMLAKIIAQSSSLIH